MGRVVGYTEYDTNGSTVTRSRSLTFDNDNRQTGQTETYQGATTTTTNTLLGDGTLSKVASTTSGTTTTTNYAYEWWDSAKQSRITEQAYNPALGMNNNRWKPGVAHYTYDVNGHLLGAIDEVGLKSFNYISNAQGQVMLREQAGNGVVQQTHRYYYAEGRTVGDVGNDGDDKQDYAAQLADTSRESNNYTARQKAYKNFRPVSSADFDQNYQPITASYPGTAPGSYTVQAGDSLYTIAASQWGDASLWYLIAEANGLSAASNLTPGQTLSIPNKVTNVHNTSATSGVYDPGKTMGDTSPTIPDAPPPPKAHHKGCGALGFILTFVVAVVVTVATSGAAAGLMGATTAAGTTTTSLGMSVLTGTATATAGMTTGSMLAAAAIGGAVGSIASQGVAIAMGMQDGFSWKGVAMSAIGAGAASGVGAIANAGMTAQQIAAAPPLSWSQAALRSAGASVATQGVGSMLGISSFSWKAVAAAAAGAGASTALSSTGWMNGLNSVAAGTVRGLVNGGIQAGIFGTRPNWGSIAAQSFGQALGDSFTQSKVNAEAQRMGDAVSGSLAEEMLPTDYSLASGGPVRFGTGSVESVSTPEELQSAFRQSERDYRSSTEQSVAGSGYVAQSGDSISRIVGTSAAQAIGNFMRANGLTSDRIEVGRNYFVPDDVMAYGDSTAAGQFALNQGNARIAAARAASLMAADGLRIGPTIERAQVLGLYSDGGTSLVATGSYASMSATPMSTREAATAMFNSLVGTSRAGNVATGAFNAWLAPGEFVAHLPGIAASVPSVIGGLATDSVSYAGRLWNDLPGTVANTMASGVDGLRVGFNRVVNGDGTAMGSTLFAVGAAGVPLGRLGVSNVSGLGYDISKWGDFGLPSDGYFVRTLTRDQYVRFNEGRQFNFGGAASAGYPGGMGFMGAAEDVRGITTGAAYRNALKLDYTPRYALEFQLRDPAGLQNVLTAPYKEFVYGGKTAAGFKEWNYPGLNSNDIVNPRVRTFK